MRKGAAWGALAAVFFAGIVVYWSLSAGTIWLFRTEIKWLALLGIMPDVFLLFFACAAIPIGGQMLGRKIGRDESSRRDLMLSFSFALAGSAILGANHRSWNAVNILWAWLAIGGGYATYLFSRLERTPNLKEDRDGYYTAEKRYRWIAVALVTACILGHVSGRQIQKNAETIEARAPITSFLISTPRPTATPRIKYERGSNGTTAKATKTEKTGVTSFGTSDEEDGYIGNTKTKKFHLPKCSYLPTEANQIYFETREEAIEEGYDPCGHCRP